jgi:hypothetical protein
MTLIFLALFSLSAKELLVFPVPHDIYLRYFYKSDATAAHYLSLTLKKNFTAYLVAITV